jgi:Arc/MetJ-type ribon-helix-helix transcriptional regulator
MEKLQILFPEPQLRRLRALAQRQDRPVSELVRAAVDLWLSRTADDSASVREDPPIFHGGPIMIPSSEMREAAYEDDDLP